MAGNCPFYNPVCKIAEATGNAFADAMRSGAKWVIENTVAWWVKPDAIDLSKTPIDTLQSWMLPIAMAVAVLGVIVAGIKMILSRKGEPLIQVGKGIVWLAVWSALAVTIVSMLLAWGDLFADYVIDQAVGSDQLADRFLALVGMGAVTNPGALIVMGLLFMIIGLIQAFLMILREGAIVVLVGVVVLAAAGQFWDKTAPWLSRTVGWLLALIFFKPVAAMVLAAALLLFGEATEAKGIITGMVMLVLSIFALPALMKLFDFGTTAVTGGGGGGGGGGLLAGVGTMAAVGMAGKAMGGVSASDQEANMNSSLGRADGSDGGGAGGPSGAEPNGGSASPPDLPTGSGGSRGDDTIDITQSSSPSGAPVSAETGTEQAAAASSAAPSGAAASSGTAAGGGAAAAAGPAGAAVAGVEVVKEAANAAKNKATDAMGPEGTS